MDLNRIAVFVRVVETESFTAAAAALGLPKSSVSRAVSRLEDDLGVRLLQRTTRKLSLTDAGHAYFDRAHRSLAGLAEATAAVSDLRAEPSGTVRLTAPVDIGERALADVVAEFSLEHPRIVLDIVLTSRRVDLIEEGFDLAVRAGRLKDSTLVARKIAESESGLFASRAYLRRKGRPKTLADLASHDCVLFRARAGKTEWPLTGPNGVEVVTVTGVICVDDFAFASKIIAHGAGIGLVPAFLCTGPDALPDLVRVLPTYTLRGAGLYVVMPSARFVPQRVALLRDFLLERLSKFPWSG